MTKITAVICWMIAFGYYSAMPYVRFEPLYFNFGVKVIIAVVIGLGFIIKDFTIDRKTPRYFKYDGIEMLRLFIVIVLLSQMFNHRGRVNMRANPSKHSPVIMMQRMGQLLIERGQ